MKTLVTNDDGIMSEGLWVLARELHKVGPVVVVAPDREQSAIGTAVTLTQPLRLQQVRSLEPGIEAWAVMGTPGDSVILALEAIARGEIDLVVSGINHGLNLGTDVLISGTVGAAMQGYLRGLPSIAVSAEGTDPGDLQTAARTASLLARRVKSYLRTCPSRANMLLNLNLPAGSARAMKGIRLTTVARESHVETVEEGHDGKRKYYWLVRKKAAGRTHPEGTDMWALEHGFCSLTQLRIHQEQGGPPEADGFCSDVLCSDLARDLAGE